MIDEICVHNIALIEEASIEPAPGLTAITGETGAGKTAILNACRLLSGQRGDKTMVREGAVEASASGRFFIPGGKGPDGKDEAPQEIVASRRMSADGRSRVKINGEIASVTELSQTISPLLDLSSQHDQLALSHASSHRSLLDLFAAEAVEEPRGAYAEAFAQAKDAAAYLEEVRQLRATSDAQAEEARFILDQIEPVQPSLGDYEELMLFVRRSENAEALARTSSEAYEALCGEEGVLDGLNAAMASLEEGARFDEPLGAHAGSLREASYVIEDVSRDVLRFRDAVDLDMSTLEQAQERMAAYQGLIRKYGPTLEDVIRRAEEAQRVVSLMEDSEGAESAAAARLREAEAALAQAAEALHSTRAEQAPSMAEQVNEVMASLQMGSASLCCQVDLLPRDQWTESGPDKVEFLFRPSAGMGERPLAKVASGGELSRVMLALHVVLGDADDVPTLIFDEIDSGVGGAVANALAEVLARLAHTHQVIVVTHLAQVASKAERHYVVSKTEADGLARTTLQAVEGEGRIAEIARMLSGTSTEASITHAKELLGL